MANLKEVVYISAEDYETLITTGTVTIGGDTLTYDENILYITPDVLASSTNDGLMSVADKNKVDNMPEVVNEIPTATITKSTNDWTVDEFDRLYAFLQNEGATSSSTAYAVDGYYYSSSYPLDGLFTTTYAPSAGTSYPCIRCTYSSTYGWMIYKENSTTISKSITVGGNNAEFKLNGPSAIIIAISDLPPKVLNAYCMPATPTQLYQHDIILTNMGSQVCRFFVLCDFSDKLTNVVSQYGSYYITKVGGGSISHVLSIVNASYSYQMFYTYLSPATSYYLYITYNGSSFDPSSYSIGDTVTAI